MLQTQDWTEFFEKENMDPKSWAKHPYHALQFDKNRSVDQIEHGMIQAVGMKNPTVALHKIIELYTSRTFYPLDKEDAIRDLFESSARKVIEKGANVEQAMEAMEPYERSRTLEISMVAREVYETLRELKNQHQEALEKIKSEEKYNVMFGQGKKRKSRSKSRRKSKRKNKSRSKKRKSSTKRKRNSIPKRKRSNWRH